MRIKNRPIGSIIKLFITLYSIFISTSCNSRDRNENKVSTESEIQVNSKLPDEHLEAIVVPYMEEGKKIYNQHCLVCHQSTGEGVLGLNPPLNDTPYVLGDKSRLLDILVNGSDVGLVVKGSTYSNAMPSFNALSNTDISNVASYIRNSFGNIAEAITTEEVTTFRTKTKE